MSCIRLNLSYMYKTHLLFSGIIYDVIVEPPSVGSTTDEHGHSRPVSTSLSFGIVNEIPYLLLC